MGENDDPTHIHLTTRIEGVVLPTWAAISLAIAAILSTLTLAFTIILATQQVGIMTREIRVLQLHVQDVESVMIEHGQAHRQDFAPWGSDITTPTHGIDWKPSNTKPEH